MVVKVLVCDDDPKFVSRLSQLLHGYIPGGGTELKIFSLSDPSQLTDQLLRRANILFLDIDMGEVSGMEIARHLRALHSNAILIFVTNYVQYSPEGYEVQAFRYILKSELEKRLLGYFEAALEELGCQKQRLDFSVSGEAYGVDHKNILYLESQRRVIYLHLLKGDRKKFHFYSTMEMQEKRLAHAGFLRVHKSYLVNMAHIEKLNYDKVQLCDGTVLPVSERKFSEVKQSYLQWKVKQ